MLTGCDECSVCPRNPEQWYAPLWLASACGMEKLEFVWANHLGFPSWKNVILYRRQFLQLWHRSTMGSPCGTSRRGVWSSSQAGRHRTQDKALRPGERQQPRACPSSPQPRLVGQDVGRTS